ncbi:hypothetical protein [Campylobacter jejuni]|uniref:hypothetical protein n=1 Tax=Campylobacter jejuni TaxID=197 RepID=UPI00155738CD|nr:hypothetical protein [Campylobacter jejuni]
MTKIQSFWNGFYGKQIKMKLSNYGKFLISLKMNKPQKEKLFQKKDKKNLVVLANKLVS